MSEHETVMVEGTECYLFPIPLSTKDDPAKDADWFMQCAYHRLFALNLPDSQRSRELSLAITNLQQAMSWLDIHQNKREFGVPHHPETGLPVNNFPSQLVKDGE